jgi:hypothetical protein
MRDGAHSVAGTGSRFGADAGTGRPDVVQLRELTRRAGGETQWVCNPTYVERWRKSGLHC